MTNNRQPRLNMHKIKQINKRYNFKIKQVRDDLALITTWCGEWYLILEENIILKHKNALFNTKREHIQRKRPFYDYNSALCHIDYHDNRRVGQFPDKRKYNKNNIK